MTSWYSSILTKLTVSFVVLILITSGLTFRYTYGATRDALKESTRDQCGRGPGLPGQWRPGRPADQRRGDLSDLQGAPEPAADDAQKPA